MPPLYFWRNFLFMKKIIIALIATLNIATAFAEKTLSFTDVMLFKWEGGFVTTENFNSEDVYRLGIRNVTESRWYKSFGGLRRLDIDYWQWPRESLSTYAGGYVETNAGLSISASYIGQEMTLSYENNSYKYIVVDLNSFMLSYCQNRDENVTFEMLPGVGNVLRNSFYDIYDFALLPPGGRVSVKYKSVMKMDAFPSNLPKHCIIQITFKYMVADSQPWEDVKEYVTRGKKPMIKDDHILFTMDSNDFGRLLYNYSTPFKGLEARYHFKVE